MEGLTVNYIDITIQMLCCLFEQRHLLVITILVLGLDLATLAIESFHLQVVIDGSQSKVLLFLLLIVRCVHYDALNRKVLPIVLHQPHRRSQRALAID